MEIKKIDIANFKGIDYLEFQPGKINLITGRNNVGKTSLLEAINLISNEDKVQRRYEYPSQVINARSAEARIRAIIKTLDGEKTESIAFRRIDPRKTDIKKELIKNLKEVISRAVEFTPEIEKTLDETLNKTLTEDLIRELAYTNIIIDRNGKEKVYLSYRPRKVYQKLSGIVMAVAEKFRQEYAEKRQSIQVKDLKDRIPMKALFDPDFLLFSLTRADRTFEYRQKKQDPIILIKDLVLKGTEDVTEGDTLRIHQIEENIKTYGLVKNLERFGVETILFKENNGFTEISYAGMGDGFKALIGLLWHLSSKDIKNKIILIEEPENHMHPGYIEQLVKIIVKFSEELDIQFFITTHNIDFIEYFFNENLPAKEKRYLNTELQVIKMEKTKNVNTLITTYNYSQAKNTLKEVLMDLRGT